MFTLHPRLEQDTFLIKKLEISQLRLMDDSRYSWVMLVPERPDITDLHHLSGTDYTAVMQEIREVSKMMEDLFSPFKLNIGALGNLVPQLHIHIIARNQEDDAWPGPVWGVGEARPYAEAKKNILLEKFSNYPLNKI